MVYCTFYRLVGVALLAMLFAGCEKTGPQGPEGPEGPPGNNGTGGGGGSAVVSYSTEGSGIDFFRWGASDVSSPLFTRYALAAIQGDGAYRRLVFTDTTGTADDALVLVYVKFIDNDGGETWTGLPYDQLDGSYGVRYHVDDLAISPIPAGGNTVEVSLGIGATQFNGPRWDHGPPRFDVDAVRVLFVPAGSVGQIGAMLHTLPMAEVMDRLAQFRN